MLTEKTSFVGFHPIPLRYGMTIGELARMFNAERKTKADLIVIELENWQRDAWLDETGLPWTNPSPNMRNLKQAILYPGIGLLESALSVGRGTDTPFELVGAPYIDDVKLADELNRAGLPGVGFVPIRFTPTASVHKGQPCGGVYVMLNDRDVATWWTWACKSPGRCIGCIPGVQSGQDEEPAVARRHPRGDQGRPTAR